MKAIIASSICQSLAVAGDVDIITVNGKLSGTDVLFSQRKTRIVLLILSTLVDTNLIFVFPRLLGM